MEDNALKKKDTLSRPLVVALIAIFCTILWGSAAPAIKTGYRLMNIGNKDIASIILFAGCRFTIAGILVLATDVVRNRRLPSPKRSDWGRFVMLALTMTVGQYVFNFIGVANASSVNASILNGSGTLFSILLACLLFRRERVTIGKCVGCVLGFGGLALMNLGGKASGVSFMGEGLMLIGAVCNGIAANQCAIYARKTDPVQLTGAQFLIGGLIMCAIGALAGGRMETGTASAWGILVYLGALSAGAYTLWNILLAHNEVSKVTVYGFLTPLSGVVISALLMGELERAISVQTLVSLACVCVGVAVVSRDSAK